jgi:hypothetical protein
MKRRMKKKVQFYLQLLKRTVRLYTQLIFKEVSFRGPSVIELMDPGPEKSFQGLHVMQACCRGKPFYVELWPNGTTLDANQSS